MMHFNVHGRTDLWHRLIDAQEFDIGVCASTEFESYEYITHDIPMASSWFSANSRFSILEQRLTSSI